jgi:hypothetical protein
MKRTTTIMEADLEKTDSKDLFVTEAINRIFNKRTIIIK